jgi:two-component system, cell cycle sensor histidine kinase and response regulator CckA
MKHPQFDKQQLSNQSPNRVFPATLVFAAVLVCGAFVSYHTTWRIISELSTHQDAASNNNTAQTLHSARIVQTGVIVGASSDLLLLALLAYFILRGSEQSRAADAAIRKSEERYRNIFEHAVLGMYCATLNGKFLSVNSALAGIVGYDSPQQMMSCITDMSHQLHVNPWRRAELLQQLKQGCLVQDFECEWYRRDGTKIWILESARPELDSISGFVYHGTIEDITERKLLEQQFRQAQKMDAVGRLAGGVAHDFNNSLGVITGYADLIRSSLHASDQHCKYFEEISKAAHRASALTRQLLAFSRKQVIQPQVIDLNSIISEAEKMLRRLIGEDIEFVFSPDLTLGRIKADVGQIDQVLLNLVLNARDAMPKGGKLIVETSNAKLDSAYVHEHPGAKAGSYVMLTVADNGCGMDNETIAHIFEPFFTTKEPGKGTGLGLSTVYGIVKQNHGYVSVDSKPGEGAAFKIYFPQVEEAAEPLKRPVVQLQALPRGRETILLVEDDETLRSVTRDCLQEAGYTVLPCADGTAALEIAARENQNIDLLFTDVIMPRMSGPQLAHAVLALRPKIKVLYISGYTNDLIAEHGVLEPGVLLLEKPCTLDFLLSKVRFALDTGTQANAAGAGG